MSDKEDATASLGHSKVLSVQNSVGEPIPEFPKRPEDGTKRPSSVDGQDTGDVFPHDPLRAKKSDQSAELQREIAAIIVESASQTGDGEGLAGGSSDKDVDGNRPSWVRLVSEDLREVAMIRHSGEAVVQNSGRKGVNLGEPRRLPAERVPSHRRRLYA
jgi:hypothetical protein